MSSTNNFTDLLNIYGTTFVTQYVKSVTGSGRKRAVYSFTCNDLVNMGAGIKSLLPNELATISLDDFYLCQTLLGQSSNQWSLYQLQVLASKALSVIL